MRHHVVIVGALAVLLSAAAAQAGWLVLRTGVAFETVGTWKIQNNWLNFTDKTSGQRKAVMVATVDIDATRDALLSGAPPKVEARKSDGPTVIDDKTVHNTGTKTARRQRAVNQVVGGLNMILYCMNSYADNEKQFDDCVKNLKF
jgi:hypothetical protein